LLIVDEVQTGCGRTGELFHYQALGIAPDIMTLGKAIGGGTPLAALLANRRASCFAPGDQGGTYCGNALLCAVGLAVMQTIATPPFLATVRSNSTYFATRLQAVSADYGLGEVRGNGFLLALELGADIAPQVVTRAREAGLLLNAPRSHCLRFMPALTISRNDIDHGLKILRTVLEQVRREQ
jgi:acetylornithine/N-succinyldiaminopimelate aminotransferase